MGMSDDVSFSFFGGWGIRAIIGVPIALGALWWGFHKKGEVDKDVLADAKALIMTAPSYAENTDYFDAVVAECHQQVFEGNYDMGGRRRSSKFYADDYKDDLFACMIAKFEADGATHIVPELKAIHDPQRH